jgi:septal ring factor EnvC (AmiA/AmiB activator)
MADQKYTRAERKDRAYQILLDMRSDEPISSGNGLVRVVGTPAAEIAAKEGYSRTYATILLSDLKEDGLYESVRVAGNTYNHWVRLQDAETPEQQEPSEDATAKTSAISELIEQLREQRSQLRASNKRLETSYDELAAEFLTTNEAMAKKDEDLAAKDADIAALRAALSGVEEELRKLVEGD